MTSKINPAIQDLAVPISTLRNYPKNYRKHDLGKIADSLRTHGQYRPIVVWEDDDPDNDGLVLCGNGTLKAARDRLAWTEIAVTRLRKTPQEAARIVADDNHINELGTNDDALLVALLQEAGVEGSSYTQDDLDKMLASLNPEPPPQAEVEFAQYVGEHHNYVVLTFDNEVDWQAAVETLGIRTVKAWDARPGYERKGIGRVIEGVPVIRRLNGDLR